MMKSKFAGVMVLLAATLSLSACLTSPAPRPTLAVYDLGAVAPLTASPGPGVLAQLEVQGPSWLDSRAMQYRLAAEPARRQNFSESRWAATPAELLTNALRRQLEVSGGEGCRLRLELDEWVQVFDGAGQSRLQLALRAALRGGRHDGRHDGRGDGLIAARSFALEQAAGGNAQQGVAAAVVLEKQLAEELAAWLQSQGDLTRRCRA